MGQRKSSRPPPELERLLDERIDLKVQLALMGEVSKADQNELDCVTSKLEVVETQIAGHARDPNRWNHPSSQ
jgi:hypothetical protein